MANSDQKPSLFKRLSSALHRFNQFVDKHKIGFVICTAGIGLLWLGGMKLAQFFSSKSKAPTSNKIHPSHIGRRPTIPTGTSLPQPALKQEVNPLAFLEWRFALDDQKRQIIILTYPDISSLFTHKIFLEQIEKDYPNERKYFYVKTDFDQRKITLEPRYVDRIPHNYRTWSEVVGRLRDVIGRSDLFLNEMEHLCITGDEKRLIQNVYDPSITKPTTDMSDMSAWLNASDSTPRSNEPYLKHNLNDSSPASSTTNSPIASRVSSSQVTRLNLSHH